MNTYFAFIRGINVGGHKKVPMAELRILLSNSGLENVQTYIQSGNVIFQSNQIDEAVLEQIIQTAIMRQFSFEVPVIIKTRDQLIEILEACPFSKEKKENSYFILLSNIPDLELLKPVQDLSYDNEEFIIVNDCLYFYSSVGYGRTKFNMNTFEKKLNVSGTSRNYKTMVKLVSLSSDLN